MGDVYPKFKAAAVQAAPVFLDREASVEKACSLMGKHRKFKATGAEKLVWGEGDGSTHKVYDTDIGRLGGLICGEHTMALPGYTLAAMGEQVHIASWVGFAFADTSLTEICSRYHAIAYNTYVICSQSVIDKNVNEKLGLDQIKPGGAWSSIIEAGTGHILAGPLLPDEEGIVYADIDLNKMVKHYFLHETTGHYWPKQFQVTFDAREIKPLTIKRSKDLRDKKTEMEKGKAEAEKDSEENS